MDTWATFIMVMFLIQKMSELSPEELSKFIENSIKKSKQ